MRKPNGIFMMLQQQVLLIIIIIIIKIADAKLEDYGEDRIQSNVIMCLRGCAGGVMHIGSE